jgi:prepilin-type N-terminal cleavage/methylation domain-containing protein
VNLRSQKGYSLVEMLVVMSILGVVMSALGALFVQSSNAQIDMNARFTAQSHARVALDRMRKDLHCASAATSSSATSVTVSSPCVSGGVLTWCTSTVAGRIRLVRVIGSTCSSTAASYSDDLIAGETYFAYQASSTQSLAVLYVCLPVNPKKGATVSTYALQGTIAFRNSTRTGGGTSVSPPVCT